MLVKKYLALCLVAAIFGCSAKSPDRAMPAGPSDVRNTQQTISKNVQAYLTALETLELDPNRYESYERYNEIVMGKMDGWLKQFDGPEELRSLFWICHSIGHANLKRESSDDHLAWIDPHFESLNSILYRLAEIRTSEAAGVLVDLWSDPKAGWDGGSGLGADDAVVQCGKPALPFLRQKEVELLREKRGVPDASRLIGLIKSGATTGL